MPACGCVGVNRPCSDPPARTVSEEWSSSGDSKTEDEEKERRSPREKDGRDKDKDADCESQDGSWKIAVMLLLL